MKRYLIVLFLLFSFTNVFAAIANPDDIEPETESVAVSVTGGISDQKFIGVGFSQTAVPQWVVEPTHLSGDSIALTPFIVGNNEDFIAKYDKKDLFLYWRTLSDYAITISLEIMGPLTNGKSNIDWDVSWSQKLDEVTQSVTRVVDIASNNNRSKVVHVCPKLLVLQTQAGSVPLTIQTASLCGSDLSAVYTGSLQLKVEVQ